MYFSMVRRAIWIIVYIFGFDDSECESEIWLFFHDDDVVVVVVKLVVKTAFHMIATPFKC